MFEIENFPSSVTIRKGDVSLSLDNANFLALENGYIGNGIEENGIKNKSWYLGDGIELRTAERGSVVIEDIENGKEIFLFPDELKRVMLNAEKIPAPLIEHDTCTLCFSDVYGFYHYSCATPKDRVKLFCLSFRGKRILQKMADLTCANIGIVVKRRCFGCINDRPSQREHSCSGLSYNFDVIDVVSENFSEAYAMIDKEKINELTMDYPNNNSILQNRDMFIVFRSCVRHMVYDLVDIEYNQ